VYDDLPRHILATGVLVWDEVGCLLLVRTHNRDRLILPGGLVEESESPAEAGRREVLEEVGLTVKPGALLVVQHLLGTVDRPASVQLVFDSAPLSDRPVLRLQPEEIAEAHWLEPAEAVRRSGERSRGRLEAALEARRRATTMYLDA